jgi:endoglucanase
MPGPIVSFQPQPNQIYLNPSYLAPYAFRLFAQVDRNHDWLSLVDSSYQVLQDSPRLSSVGLPSDWVMLDLETGQFSSPPVSARLRSTYSFDAYRVWWRVALDAVWFNEPRAKAFLQTHLAYLQEQWQSNQRIPARINLRGAATARYEATSQYAMLYPAFRVVDDSIAEEIRQQKLLSTYNNGIWDNDSAYYVQNLAWLGLYPAAEIDPDLLRSR